MVFRVRAYAQGGQLGTLTASQHNFFDSEKLKVLLVLLTGFEPSTFGSPVQCSNHRANPSPLYVVLFWNKGANRMMAVLLMVDICSWEEYCPWRMCDILNKRLTIIRLGGKEEKRQLYWSWLHCATDVVIYCDTNEAFVIFPVEIICAIFSFP